MSPSPQYEIFAAIKSEPTDRVPSSADTNIIVISFDKDEDGPVHWPAQRHQKAVVNLSSADEIEQPLLGQRQLRKIVPPLDTDSSSTQIQKWPGDFYVIDIVHCFDMCEAEKGKPRSSRRGDVNAICFEWCFPGIPFKSSTFHDNHRRWNAAPQHIRDAALEAGQTKAGLWSAFGKKQAAPDAVVRNARKKAHRQAQKSLGAIVEDDDDGWV